MPTASQDFDNPPIVLPIGRLLSSDEVCAALNIRRLHLYELIRRGELPSVRIGRLHRFLPSDIVAFIGRGGDRSTAP